MSIPKKIQKSWSGNCSFQAIEMFDSIEAAAKQSLPSTAAKIEVNNDSLSFTFSRVKWIGGNGEHNHTRDSVRKDLAEDRAEGKRKESDTAKDQQGKK